MGKNAVSFTVGMPGLPALLRDLNAFGPEVQARVRDASGKIAEVEAERVVTAASAAGRQAVLAAQSVKVRRDRVPVIVAGGRRKLRSETRRKVQPTAGQVFFGAEFGGGGKPTTQQFEPHKGTEGYWFFPTLRDDEDQMLTAYAAVLDEVLG